jgi:DNA-binding IscR family transcriptional regulator
MLQNLVKQGVINSLKGPTGGFFMSEEQLGQPIIKIVQAIDGNQIFKDCGLV